MRRIQLFILLAVAWSGSVGGQASPLKSRNEVEDDKREILKTEDETKQSLLTGDWHTIDRIWDDDIVYDNEGGPATKSEVLKFLKNGLAGDGTESAQHFYTLVHNDVQVRVYGDTAVLTTYSTSKIFDRGKWSLGPRQATKVYAKRDGQWILVVRVHAPVTKE